MALYTLECECANSEKLDEKKLPIEPLNEGHIATRFVPQYHGWLGSQKVYEISVSGDEILARDCMEVCPGENGFVVVYENNASGASKCTCDYPASYKKRIDGSVTLRMTSVDV